MNLSTPNNRDSVHRKGDGDGKQTNPDRSNGNGNGHGMTAAADFPRASAATRNAPGLALSAGPTAVTCNQWHELVGLSLLERCLLPLLDGEHSHEALAEHLAAEARAGRLRFIKDEKPLTDEATLREFTRKQVAAALRDLRRKALLKA